MFSTRQSTCVKRASICRSYYRTRCWPDTIMENVSSLMYHGLTRWVLLTDDWKVCCSKLQGRCLQYSCKRWSTFCSPFASAAWVCNNFFSRKHNLQLKFGVYAQNSPLISLWSRSLESWSTLWARWESSLCVPSSNFFFCEDSRIWGCWAVLDFPRKVFRGVPRNIYIYMLSLSPAYFWSMETKANDFRCAPFFGSKRE